MIHSLFHIFQISEEIKLIYYTLRFYFPYLSLLAQPVNITLYRDRDWTASFWIRFRNGTCIIILDEKYNIANSSCHFGSYGSIWTGPYAAI